MCSSDLTLETTAGVFEAVRARAAPGSVLVVTFFVSPEPRDLLHAWYQARKTFFRLIGEPRRSEYRPGDPEKLYVVTGWGVTRSKSWGASRVDRAARMLVLAGEPR